MKEQYKFCLKDTAILVLKNPQFFFYYYYWSLIQENITDLEIHPQTEGWMVTMDSYRMKNQTKNHRELLCAFHQKYLRKGPS